MSRRLPHMLPERLQALFEKLNHQLFGGRLPRYMVRFGPSGRLVAESGYCDSERKTIYVDPNPPTRALLRQVLLHEMCHIGTPGHGSRFQKKLRRLAALGETWANREADECAEARAMRVSPTAAIVRELKDMAIEQPAAEWPHARGVLAFRMGRLEAEIDRIAPWAARLWDRESTKARQRSRKL